MWARFKTAPLADDEGERSAGVFLTNALTGCEPRTNKQLPFAELDEERDRAEQVKQDGPTLVILGNPPYNGFAGMAVDEERGRSEACRSTKLARRLEGQGLNDLHVRFFRMAEKTGQGVVCFIDDSVQTLPDLELLETALSSPPYGTGDDGKLTGVFVRRHHQGPASPASTLVRCDLKTAFSATR
ncbi:MAG: hypothetical protein OXB98_22245 [Bryobacterales bacterium]|nr:hypothetical protein [Bryobacterales bacterium]